MKLEIFVTFHVHFVEKMFSVSQVSRNLPEIMILDLI